MVRLMSTKVKWYKDNVRVYISDYHNPSHNFRSHEPEPYHTLSYSLRHNFPRLSGNPSRRNDELSSLGRIRTIGQMGGRDAKAVRLTDAVTSGAVLLDLAGGH